jgi:hypothetical protein
MDKLSSFVRPYPKSLEWNNQQNFDVSGANTGNVSPVLNGEGGSI